jgi:hypothetical protein
MSGKITLALLLALTIVAAPLPASARTCILSNTATAKACKPACCANMSCCDISPSNTAPAAPPVAKSSDNSDITLFVAPTATMRVAAVDFPPVRLTHSDADFFAHSPPILALNCARLI